MNTARVRQHAKTATRVGLGVAMLALLAACDEAGNFSLGQQARPEASDADVTANARSVKLIERDVEAPDVFQVTEPGLWDGRPSLGGVWVAHPDVSEPERVIIRNTKNGKFVIGALFRRERESPGPAIQVSSDAAAALGMLAGQPGTLNVTALRREEVPEATPETPAADAPVAALDAPADVAQKPLDPVATASAALDAVEARPVQTAAAAAPAPSPVAPKPRSGGLDKPFIQIGIFSVEQNAQNTAQSMRTAGMLPTVKQQSSKGKTFWRVLVGPATSASERSALLKQIKDKGFSDAYAVTN